MRALTELQTRRYRLDWESSCCESEPFRPELHAGDSVVCNATEMTEWQASPVGLSTCPYCGPICGEGTVAHRGTLGNDLLLIRTAPHEIPDERKERVSSRLDRSFVIPGFVSEAVRHPAPVLPRLSEFPRVARKNLVQTWIDTLPREFRFLDPAVETPANDPRVRDLAGLEALGRTRRLASDSLDRAGAPAGVGKVIDWIKIGPNEDVYGRVIKAAEDTPVETFYLQGPSILEWPALSTSLEHGLARGGSWLLADRPSMGSEPRTDDSAQTSA